MLSGRLVQGVSVVFPGCVIPGFGMWFFLAFTGLWGAEEALSRCFGTWECLVLDLLLMLQRVVYLGKKLGNKCYVLSLGLLLFCFMNSGV